jgi:hypothetical protein
MWDIRCDGDEMGLKELFLIGLIEAFGWHNLAH